ncbi:MAG: DUF3565 domain-containing protein [Pirellulaceae bacterium]|nr:DUF3565 domain-containing protein [Pirellulaceae bacterium]
MNMNKATTSQPITGYHTDEQGHWVAQLACGHNQHVRHDPPWVHRQWVTSQAGRESMLGHQLVCKKCADGSPKDEQRIETPRDGQ